MNPKQTLALILILTLAFLLCCIPLKAYHTMLSWEGFYHVRIAENIVDHTYLYDTGSFGPEGRVQVHPPIYHGLVAVLLKVVPESVLTVWAPPLMLILLLGMWYTLISSYYTPALALLSSLFLVGMPAFIDIGFLFSPLGLALILVVVAFYFLKKNYLISGILGGLVVMTQFTAAFFFFLVVGAYILLNKEKRISLLKVVALSLLIASPFLGYFVYHLPSINPVLGFPELKYLLDKITIVLPALAILGLRRDAFAISLSAGGILAFVQPTNIVYITFALSLFSALFIYDFLVTKKWTAIVLIFVFWLCLVSSQEYASKLQPAASEYPSFVWLKDNSAGGTVASGWFQAPIIAEMSERPPVLGFGFPEESRIEDMRSLYQGDKRILDKYDISYVYYGKFEAYDYPDMALDLDKVYSGKGDFYTREPPVIFVLITVDVECDVPPVLSTCKGMEEGLPYIVQELKRYKIPATFFVLGETAQKYPDTIKELSASYEIGCHSMYHVDMRSLSDSEKEEQVGMATHILEELAGEVHSFRAPGHSCDSELLDVLMKYGYTVEASACREFSYPYYPSKDDWLTPGELPILRVPISHTPAYFYAPLVYPGSWVDAYLNALQLQDERIKIIVIGLHPWEFVELWAAGYESLTQASGEYSQTEFSGLLWFLGSRRVTFLTVNQLCEQWKMYHYQSSSFLR
ncbi:MAG: polysaccharide deacetylase family protein [Theionarchaea archaeon]|nr:polysaccharide deacetylase family protein [Theionarchaea archaeon]